MSEIFNESTLDVIVRAYAWYLFAPVILGLVYRNRLNRTQKIIFYVAILSALNYWLGYFIAQMFKNNLWVYHLYVPLLFYFTWKIYSQELKSLFSVTFFRVILVIAIGFFVVNTVFWQPLEQLPTYAIFSMCMVFIIWCVSYYYSLLKQTQYRSLEREPLFWFNTGVLLYYSSTILLFLLVFNILKANTEANFIASIMNALFNLVLVTAYLISLWVRPPQ